MSYSRVDYKWDQRRRDDHPYQLHRTENYNNNCFWPNYRVHPLMQGNRPFSSFQHSHHRGSMRPLLPPPPLMRFPAPPPHGPGFHFKEEKHHVHVDPISKESRDTLRNRIRNETQLQEEKDKEHQDQVKDKVRQLQKKLTSSDSNTTVSENRQESTAATTTASTSSNHGRPQPNLSETKSSASTRVPAKSVNKKNKSSKKASKSSSKKTKRNKPSAKSTKKYKSKDNASVKKKQIPKPPRGSASNNRRFKNSVDKKNPKPSTSNKNNERIKAPIPKRDPKPLSEPLNYDRFKASIAKKDPKYLKELIESPSFLKKVLMTKLVEDHRKQISDKLNQLRFNHADEVAKNNDSDRSDPFFEVDFKELPTDFLSEISNLILSQKQCQGNDQSNPSMVTATSTDLPFVDEDIMEVPVPPKTPPPCFDLSDGEEVNEKSETECNTKKLFADKLLGEIEILNQEEKTLKDKLEALSVERNNLNKLLSNISETRNKLLLESASLLRT